MNRSIVTCILLSVVTCGIYGIYWFVKITDEMNALAEVENPTSGGVAFLLTLITCGIYGWYWVYKMGENVETLKARKGEPAGSSLIIFIVLAIFGLQIVNYCLIQDSINKNVSAA